MHQTMIAVTVVIAAFLVGDIASSWVVRAAVERAEGQSAEQPQSPCANRVHEAAHTSSPEKRQILERIDRLEKEVHVLRRDLDELRTRLDRDVSTEEDETVPPTAGAIIGKPT